MSNLLVPSLYIFLSRALLIQADNVNLCYFGPGEENRAFSDLVPCSGSGTSACCLLGSVCLTGNACWDPTTGDTYQYGCTDITYTDQSCPSKCGFNTTRSNWVAMEYCGNFASDTWACHAPESCGQYCPVSEPWNPNLQILTPNACSDMKSDARVALYAPSTIDHILSLPSTYGGSTGYYPPGSTTVEPGYTPKSVVTPTTYAKTVPTTPVVISPDAGSEELISTAPVQLSSGGEILASTPTTTATASASSAPTTTSAPSSSSLSTGSKVGIGIGVAAGCLLLAFLAVVVFKYHKGQQQRLAQQPPFQPYQPYQPYQQHPQQPPMQGMPHYSTQTDRTHWSGGYAPPGTQMSSTTYMETSHSPQPKVSPVELGTNQQRLAELESEEAPSRYSESVDVNRELRRNTVSPPSTVSSSPSTYGYATSAVGSPPSTTV